MRYFFVSDIHGEYKKLISALKQTGFNEATDTLVSVGDPFDRGPDNEKVLQFLLGLPNKILLWGNHDARLKILVDGTDDIAAYDFHNCTTDTIRQLSKSTAMDFTSALNTLRYNDSVNADLKKYFSLCHMALEFPDLIATHAWLPSTVVIDRLILKDSWRQIKSWKRWYDALWSNTEYAVRGAAYPDKQILVGHWYAFLIAELQGHRRQFERNLDTSTYETKDAIFIDGCSYDEFGQVNVYVKEETAQPILYDAI